MYTKHFGLKMLPFENVPDPVFFFDQGDHARIRSRVTESLKAGRGLTVVTGPIGSGKTTLSQKIIFDLSLDTKGIKRIWMAEPPGNSTDLFLFIARELGVKPSSPERVFIIRDIQDALLKINSGGNKCLMIIDESHLMTDEVLNGIRLLNNLEEGSVKLIQVLLLGQLEMMGMINKPEMESCKQRIATLEIIGEMNSDRIRKYILHRIQVAGGPPLMFTDTGWEALIIAFGSGSTPRTINSLCDKSLSMAFEREKTVVDVDDVYEAAKGMGLGKDVFHYQIALKRKEQEKEKEREKEREKDVLPEKKKITAEEPGPAKEPVPAQEPDMSGQGLSSGRETDHPDMAHQNSQSGVSELIHQETGAGSLVSQKDVRGMKIPVLFLMLSIAALILSIFFYGQRSGSPDLMTSLQELIRF